MQMRLDDTGKTNLAIFLLFFMLIMFSVFMIVFFDSLASESAQSIYDYELSLSTSEPIENVVLLIPVPSYYNADSGQNETIINLDCVTFDNFDKIDTLSTKIEQVHGIPMLNISAGRINPLYQNRIEPIAIMPGQNISELPQPTHLYSDRYSEETPVLVAMKIHLYDSDVGHTIDTRMPFGTEPLFMPYRILENFTCPEGGMYGGYYVRDKASASLFEVPFILSYTCDDDNVFTISTELRGMNEWWVGGWRGNSYRERISHEFTGKTDGVYWVKGVLVMGEGVY